MVEQQLSFELKREYSMVKYQENDRLGNYQYQLNRENQEEIHPNEQYQNQSGCPKKTKLEKNIIHHETTSTIIRSFSPFS